MRRLESGDLVISESAQYTVTDPVGFAGTLPTAVINPGYPNAGHDVILTSAFTKEEK